MKSSHSWPVACSTWSRSARAEPGQRGPEPVLERAGVAAPAGEGAADQQVDRDRDSRRQVEPAEQDRLVRARSARSGRRPRSSSAMANSTVESRASLRLTWPWPRLVASRVRSPSCQLRAGVADAAVDLGLDIDAEEALAGSVPSLMIRNRLMYWPGEASRRR